MFYILRKYAYRAWNISTDFWSQNLRQIKTQILSLKLYETSEYSIFLYGFLVKSLSSEDRTKFLMRRTVNPTKDWRFRTHNLKVPSFGQSLKKTCVWALCCGVLRLWNFSKFPFVWALCCGVWGLWIFRVPLGVGSVLWCVKTLGFKVPMCVGSMLWRVRILSFQSSPVCGPCAAVCGDFEIFHKAPLYVGPVLCCMRTWNFQSYPVYSIGLCCGAWGLWVPMTVCGIHDMACEDFEFSKFPYMCVSSVLWCVKTLSF